MQVIVLCGGAGTRFNNVVFDLDNTLVSWPNMYKDYRTSRKVVVEAGRGGDRGGHRHRRVTEVVTEVAEVASSFEPALREVGRHCRRRTHELYLTPQAKKP